MRCYAPSTSFILALVVIGYVALRDTAGHALAGAGLITAIVIAVGCCLLTTGLIVVSAAAVRRRRTAAGGCLTCTHPCREAATGTSSVASGPSVPSWPDRPLTRAALPVVVIPRQRPTEDAGAVGASVQPARARARAG